MMARRAFFAELKALVSKHFFPTSPSPVSELKGAGAIVDGVLRLDDLLRDQQSKINTERLDLANTARAILLDGDMIKRLERLAADVPPVSPAEAPKKPPEQAMDHMFQ